MRISYNKLWKMLIDKNMKKSDLREKAGISSASLAKLGKGDNITTDVLLRICEVKLIGEFNLHTVVRLPSSVFSPYTSITTNLLFFDNTKPTTETWFYRVDIPSDRKHFSKTKPMELKHFDDCIAWWNNREVIPDGEYFKSQKFTADYLLNEQGCNIDLCGYPHEEEEVLDPLDTIREYQERRTSLNAEIDKVLAELEALLPGGVKE